MKKYYYFHPVAKVVRKVFCYNRQIFKYVFRPIARLALPEFYQRQVEHANEIIDTYFDGAHMDNNARKRMIDEYLFCYCLIGSEIEFFVLNSGLQGKSRREISSFMTNIILSEALLGRDDSGRREWDEVQDKYGCYEKLKEYYKREIIHVQSEEDYPMFEQMALSLHRFIIKPNEGMRGVGISECEVTTASDARACFERMMAVDTDWVVEEKIEQDTFMAQWNPSSVNTVRFISTLDSHGNYNVITPILKTGRVGSIVDNVCNGGIMANIDIENGIINTDGWCHGMYARHPDSNVAFRGIQIPRWGELCDLIKEIHTTRLTNHKYIGWDCSLTKDRGWCIIEINWGEFGNQAIDKVGRREQFMKYTGLS